jgi:phage terminase small subunit
MEGTARADRMPKDEPPVPEGEVVRPKFLKGRARKLWDQYAPALEKMGTLTVVDTPNFATWCVLMAAFEKDGADMKASQIAQLRMLGDALGMSASGRAKIGGSNGKSKKKADPAERFFGATG